MLSLLENIIHVFFTWVFIQLMAFSGPINLYLTGISKPYTNRAIYNLFHLFASHLTADGTTWQ